MSRKKWEGIGKKAGWLKSTAQYGSWDELSLGPTPAGEPCAQLGSANYEKLSRIELRAYANQINRLFPNMPYGVQLKKQRNIHDFGTYYELAIKYLEDNEDAINFAINVENNTPEYWDEEAKIELGIS